MMKLKAALGALVLLGATGAMANELCSGDQACAKGQGGSGTSGMESSGTGSESSSSTTINVQPQENQPATGTSIGGYGGSGTELSGTEMTTPAPAPTYTYKSSDRYKPDLKGVQVQVGGGVEGYTGQYAGKINPGPGWDGTVGIKPWKALGLELGYSGAANELDKRYSPGDGPANGADIVRNGGQASVILSAPTAIAPYAMGGVGIDWYNFRGIDGQGGFRDDTAGSIPVGVGLRSTVGHFTADLRGTYSYPFSENFAPVSTNNVGSGRYGALLNVGGAF